MSYVPFKIPTEFILKTFKKLKKKKHSNHYYPIKCSETQVIIENKRAYIAFIIIMVVSWMKKIIAKKVFNDRKHLGKLWHNFLSTQTIEMYIFVLIANAKLTMKSGSWKVVRGLKHIHYVLNFRQRSWE